MLRLFSFLLTKVPPIEHTEETDHSIKSLSAEITDLSVHFERCSFEEFLPVSHVQIVDVVVAFRQKEWIRIVVQELLTLKNEEERRCETKIRERTLWMFQR